MARKALEHSRIARDKIVSNCADEIRQAIDDQIIADLIEVAKQHPIKVVLPRAPLPLLAPFLTKRNN